MIWYWKLPAQNNGIRMLMGSCKLHQNQWGYLPCRFALFCLPVQLFHCQPWHAGPPCTSNGAHAFLLPWFHLPSCLSKNFNQTSQMEGLYMALRQWWSQLVMVSVSFVLSAVAFATRATVHTTWGATPSQLVFGRAAMVNTKVIAD